MKNFIPAVRTDRYREMKEYESKGYNFILKRKYIKVDEIKVLHGEEEYSYRVHVTQKEIYFHLMNKSANIYLSISDLYETLILNYNDVDKPMLIGDLKRYITERKKDIFLYKDVEYKMKKISCSEKEKAITIPNTTLKISALEFMIVIGLIQEKSNQFFVRSKKYKNYKNGLIRLLIVLLECTRNDELLRYKGWEYSEKIKQYSLADENYDENRFKYYLTKKEYENIMGGEES